MGRYRRFVAALWMVLLMGSTPLIRVGEFAWNAEQLRALIELWLPPEARRDLEQIRRSLRIFYQQALAAYDALLAGLPLEPAPRLQMESQLISWLAREHLRRQIRISEEEIQAYYEQNREQFYSPERRKVAMLLAADWQSAQQALEALQAGQPWQEVFQQFNTDASLKERNGVVGWLRKENVSDELKILFTLPEGGLSPPIPTTRGVAIYRILEIQPEQTKSLEEVREIVRQQLENQKLRAWVKENFQRWIQELETRYEGFFAEERLQEVLNAKPAYEELGFFEFFNPPACELPETAPTSAEVPLP